MTPKDLKDASDFLKDIFYLKADIPVKDSVLRKLTYKYQDFNQTAALEIFERNSGKVKSFKQISAKSTFHLLFKADLEKGGAKVIKINALNKIYHAFHFLVEKWIVSLLKDSGIPVVAIDAVDLERGEYAFDYLVMDKAKGREMQKVVLSKDNKDILFRGLGSLVAKFHKLNTTNFGPFNVEKIVKTNKGVGIFSSWGDYIFLNLKKHIDFCKEMGTITDKEAFRIEEMFEEYQSLFGKVKPVLVHNDLNIQNFFTDRKKITGIVDWEDAISGDPVFDIANFGTFFAFKNTKRVNFFLDGYKSINELPDDFEKRYWLYYLRIALAKTVHRWRFGYPDPKGIPPPSSRIQQALKKLKSYTGN